MKRASLRPLSLALIVATAALGACLVSGCGGDSESLAYQEYVAIGGQIDELGGEVDAAVHRPNGSDAQIARQFAAFGGTARRYAAEIEALEVDHDLVARRNRFGSEVAAYGNLLGVIALGAAEGDTRAIGEGVRELAKLAKLLNADGQVFAKALEEEG